MCGIIGHIGRNDCVSLLLEGLKRLEYRGYDSAGIAVISDGKIDVRRCQGKLVQLEALLEEQPVRGSRGIGHTRWATHGPPSDVNAHPHKVGPIALVHNGIIENYLPLRIRKYCLRKGSGGKGKNKGGEGITREYEFSVPTQVTILSERRKI